MDGFVRKKYQPSKKNHHKTKTKNNNKNNMKIIKKNWNKKIQRKKSYLSKHSQTIKII